MFFYLAKIWEHKNFIAGKIIATIILLIQPFCSPAQLFGSFIPQPGQTINYTFVEKDTLTPGASDLPFYPFTVVDSAVAKYTYLEPSSTPYDTGFTQPRNLSLNLDERYVYYSADSATGWNVTGYGSEILLLEYSDPLALFTLPLVYDAADHQLFSDLATSIYFHGGIETHRTAEVTGEVDAEGLLQVIDQDTIEVIDETCLRIKILETYHDDTYVNGEFFRSYETTVESYYWIAEESGGGELPEEIRFIYQTISFSDFNEPVNNSSRTYVRYNQ